MLDFNQDGCTLCFLRRWHMLIIVVTEWSGPSKGLEPAEQQTIRYERRWRTFTSALPLVEALERLFCHQQNLNAANVTTTLFSVMSVDTINHLRIDSMGRFERIEDLPAPLTITEARPTDD
jgi:hypothetical protein